MAQIKVVAINDDNRGLEFGRVVWGDKGQPFVFKFSPKGTNAGAQAITETGTIDADELVKLINAEVGYVIKQNPKWEDVKTDDGSNGDNAADDGVNDGTRYNWASENGQLFTATKV